MFGFGLSQGRSLNRNKCRSQDACGSRRRKAAPAHSLTTKKSSMEDSAWDESWRNMEQEETTRERLDVFGSFKVEATTNPIPANPRDEQCFFDWQRLYTKMNSSYTITMQETTWNGEALHQGCQIRAAKTVRWWSKKTNRPWINCPACASFKHSKLRLITASLFYNIFRYHVYVYVYVKMYVTIIIYYIYIYIFLLS